MSKVTRLPGGQLVEDRQRLQPGEIPGEADQPHKSVGDDLRAARLERGDELGHQQKKEAPQERPPEPGVRPPRRRPARRGRKFNRVAPGGGQERPHERVGRGHISQFIESLVHSYVVTDGLDQAYREMAQDARRESDALAWAEATTIDTAKAMGRGQAL